MCSQTRTPSHLLPRNISVGHPHAPAPSMLYPVLDIDWQFNSYMIAYMFQCHSPKSSVLTVASWPAYRFLKRQIRWSGIPSPFRIFHTVKGFGIVNKAKIDVFLELSWVFHDPADVGNLISGFSAFSKSSLNIRKFTVHVLLKPGSENFECYFTIVCCCC